MNACKTTFCLLEIRLFSSVTVGESKMSLQYVLCSRFLTVDFEKKESRRIGKELQQRVEF